MTARERIIEAMRMRKHDHWHGEGVAGAMLDAVSDELLVEYLRERGVLVPAWSYMVRPEDRTDAVVIVLPETEAT